MFRKPTMKLMSAALVLLGVTACSPEAAPEKDWTNIVFIIADDLGYGDLGCYGQAQIQTPNIDRIAAEGVRFTDFYAGSTVCAPSRCVLMTGLHTGHALIRGNGKNALRPEDVTVAELLKPVGYQTGQFGKWGLGYEGSTGIPTKQGFDSFFGYLDQKHAHNYYPPFLIRNGERVALKNVMPADADDGGFGVALEKVEYSHDLIVKEALGFVEQNKDKPFFLYMPLTIPHANNEAGDKGMEVPDYGSYADKDWPEPQKGLAAMVTRMDSDIGRLLDLLKQYQIDEKTIIFFTSDNGPHREGGNDPEFFDSNGALKGIKRDLYEGGIRVPMIVRWPGRTAPGSISHHAGYFADVMPTLCEIADVEPPVDSDGVSFLPAILGDVERQQKHDFLYWEFYERGSAQAVRWDHWKAVRKPMFTGEIEVYNLAEDLGEEKNLASDQPELVAKAEELLASAHVSSPLWKTKK